MRPAPQKVRRTEDRGAWSAGRWHSEANALRNEANSICISFGLRNSGDRGRRASLGDPIEKHRMAGSLNQVVADNLDLTTPEQVT